MGNGVSRVVGCFVPGIHDHEKLPVYFSEPLDEGLGHSFCYVRPVLDSPHASPPHSDRFLSLSLPLDSSDTSNGSFQLNQENAEDSHKLKILSETSFKSISGASVSANTSTPRTIASREQFSSFANILDDRAAAFESTSSFSALPLQPVPRGLSQSGPITGSQFGQASGPLDRGFLSGPLERGFMSGPIERGFLSGPLERGCMSGPIEATDRSIFSAPLAGPYATYLRRRRRSLAYLVRTFGNPVKKVLSRSLSKTTSTLARTQRSLAAPVKLAWGHAKYLTREETTHHDCPLDFGYTSSDLDLREIHNLQWAQGKAGEDRVHVVLSEEHGWLFVGIFDGFNGPDAPDFLMSNLYHEIYKELRGLLWDREKGLTDETQQGVESKSDAGRDGLDLDQGHGKASVCGFGSREEGRNSEAGSQVQPNASSSDRNCSYLKEATRQIHGAECVRRDKENVNAELDGCSSPAGGHEISVTQSGARDFGCEMLSHASNDISETSAQQSLTVDGKNNHQLETQPDLFALNKFKKGVEGTNRNVHCEDNDGTERVTSEGHNFQQNKQISRIGKQRKIWSGRPLFKLKLKKARTKGKEDYKRPITCGLELEQQDRKGRQRKSEDNYKQGADKPCKNGNADHNGVLEALARALASTERAYLQMADHSMEETPELALMGSCLLVMLMKGEDVYVMNVGDSRAILAQVKSDPQVLSSFSRDPAVSEVDDSERIGARDSQLRQELERIMEENPTELETFESSHTSSSAGPPATSLSLSALQLSSDHSTSIEEEVLRIKAEHPDDRKSISNERVKGRLKVTRAFGAGFLKLPRWNNALLEMFRVDYVGTAPYVTCTPALHHHMLGPNDRFLVLSSDGLYQYLSNEEVVSHVEWFMDKFPDGDPAQHLIEELLFRAAKKAGMDFHELLDIPQGDRRKYHDDVSVMVISIEGRIWRSFG